MKLRSTRIQGYIALLLFVMAGAARAHSFPMKENPAAGADLTSSPKTVTIRFDAPIEHLFAKLEVASADGKALGLGTPQVSADGYTLSVNLPTLPPGDYKVNWSVVCVDTHHTNGSYDFSVIGKRS